MSPRGQIVQCSEKLKKMGATSQILQASVSVLNGKFHDSTLRKRLKLMACLEGLLGESLFSLRLGLQSCNQTNLLENFSLDR